MSGSTTILRIGARGSGLSQVQARGVAESLRRAHPSLTVEFEWLKTQGDRDAHTALSQLGGEGVFAKEIEAALLDERVDLAVHSLKDLPTAGPEGLVLAAIPERADPADALISPSGRSLNELPPEPRIGTGSARRAAQLRFARPDAVIVPIRGNVDTRLRKLEGEGFDAIVLACAGIHRMGLATPGLARLEPAEFPHAPGQGALAIQCRADDERTNALLARLDHVPTHQAIAAERAVLHHLGGGCQIPLGVCAAVADGRLELAATVTAPDGSSQIQRAASGASADGEALGRELAETLVAAGGLDLLKAG